MASIVTYLAVIFIAFFLGKRVLDLLVPGEQRTALEDLFFSLSLGLGTMGLIILAVGLAGFLTAPVLYGLLFLGLVLSFREAGAYLKWRVSFQRIRSAWPHLKLSWLEIILVVQLLAVFFFCFLYILAPIYCKFAIDITLYHFLLPKLYADHHAIFHVPGKMESEWPFLIEMFVSLGLVMKSEALAKMLVLTLNPLAGLAVFLYSSRQYITLRQAVITGVVFFSIPFIALLMPLPLVDLPLTLYVFLSLHALLNWSHGGNRGWLMVAGILIGFACGIKISGLIFFFFLLILIVVIAFAKKKMSLKQLGSNVLLFSFFAAALMSPWYIKSFVHTGNPCYPFLSGWFTELGLQKYPILFGEDYGGAFSLSRLLQFPWDVTMNMKKYGGSIGPWFLAIMPFAVYHYRKSQNLLSLSLWLSLAFILAINAFGIPNMEHVRYVMPLLLISSVPVAVTIDALSAKGGILRFTVITCICVMSLLTPTYLTHKYADLFPQALGVESKEAFLARTHPAYEIIQFANRRLPDTVVIQLNGHDGLGYFSEKEFLVSNLTPQTRRATHIIIEDASFPALRQQGMAGRYKEIYKKDGIGLYKIVGN
ncbi:MAG: hypothetical protein HYU64_14700 [Armatimonadetes bacterium]|nr:hypothetical protein [Armatimonadota bacterium]